MPLFLLRYLDFAVLLLALPIFVVGLAEREAGLAAAILSITLFTFYFTSQMLTRPFEDPKS